MSLTVFNISRHGFWLWLDGQEVFLPFEQFPWFRQAAVGQICAVERVSPHHLYWPELDIDLSVESVFHPEKFPLVSRGEA